jgi:hypothetical protein
MPKNELRNFSHGLDQLPSTQPNNQINIEAAVPMSYTSVFYGKLGQTNDLSFFEDFASIPVMLEEVPFSNSIINNVVFDIGVRDKSRGG